MTLSSGEAGFGFAASFQPPLTGGVALCFRWANRSLVVQIEKTNTSATTHFEKRMSTGLSP
jgi:hypothetical protein